MIVVLVFILLFVQSVSFAKDDFTRDWKQKGCWKSTKNQTNVISELLIVNKGTVEFEYIRSNNWAFLTFKGKDESTKTVRVFLKMDLNKSSQIVELEDLQVELSLYKKHYWSDVKINSSKIFFNVTYKMRQFLVFNSKKHNFKVSFINVEKQYPSLASTLMKIQGFILVLAIILMFKSLKNRFLSNFLGVYSIVSIHLWLMKCFYTIVEKTYYLQNSEMLGFVRVLSTFQICFLLCSFCFYVFWQGQNDQNRLGNISNLVIKIIYVAMFLCLLWNIFPLRLWCILLIPIINQLLQVFEGKYGNSKGMAKDALLLFVLYFLLIAIFPIYSEEIDYPKEQASAWWIYGSFYFLQVGLFYLKTKGGIAFLRRTKLLTMQWLKKEGYSTLKEYCPICYKPVPFSDVGLAEAGKRIVDWVKGPCEHYFHKRCVKDNMYELDRCSIDNYKWSYAFRNQCE